MSLISKLFNQIFKRTSKRVRQHKQRLEKSLGAVKVKLDMELAKKILGIKGDLHAKLATGPMDSVLGFLNRENGRLEIDILETFAHYRPSTSQEFDDVITQVVCHEMWHAKQAEKYGPWFFYVKLVYWMVAMFVYFYILPITSFMWLFEPTGWQLLILIPALYADIRLGLKLTSGIAYFLAPEEIGARLYARNHWQDPAWRDVIIVEHLSREETLRNIFREIIIANTGGVNLKKFELSY